MNTSEIEEHFTMYLPEHMRKGLFDYLNHGTPPGGFLTAILANDFHGAVARADSQNNLCLKHWAELLTILPMEAWGSYEKVEAWCVEKRRASKSND